MDQKKTIKILATVSLVAIALLSLLLALRKGNNESPIGDKEGNIIYKNLNPLEKNIIRILKQYEVPQDKNDLKISLLIETGIREIKVILPKGRPMEEVIYSLHTASKGTKYKLVDSYHSDKRDQAELTFKSNKKNREDIIVRIKRGRKYASYIGDLAIIVSDIDDIAPKDRVKFLTFDKGKINYLLNAWEKNLDSVYSVLNKYETPIIVGYPLESKLHKENKKTQFTIYLDDSPELIKRKVDDLLRHTPQIEAIASVGGSRVLSASSTAEPFFKKIKKHNLIFFDRRQDIKNNTTAKEIAQSEGLTYFIDNSPLSTTKKSDLKKELKNAAYKATKYGKATIWLPASGNLIEVIEELSPYFETRGVKLSSVKKCYQ